MQNEIENPTSGASTHIHKKKKHAQHGKKKINI